MILTRRHKAQAATELAIFGAIIIFVLGTIIRSAVSSGQGQDASLKAMRNALVYSSKSTAGDAKKGIPGDTSRSNASILYVEDRLSPDFGKFGSVERAPFIAQGSGSMTNTLTYPLDLNELGSCNGLPSETYRCQQYPGHTPVMDMFINGKHFTFSMAALMHKTVPPGSIFYQIVVNMDDNNSSGGKPSSSAQQEALEKKFCVTDPCPGPLTLQQRFDLNRDGNFTNDPPPPPYADMAWQWRGVQAIMANVSKDKALYIDPATGVYPSFDVDGDGQEETIYGFDHDANGAITAVTVLDSQDGDLDFSGDATASGKVGLLNDVAIYTRLATGSEVGNYLLMQQGKMYGLDGKFIRSVSRKDQVDLVERKIQLSNDTGRMCTPVDSGNPTGPKIGGDVEACDDCFGANFARTCFDKGSKILYVRSRLLDQHGHFWKTDASGQLNLGK